MLGRPRKRQVACNRADNTNLRPAFAARSAPFVFLWDGRHCRIEQQPARKTNSDRLPE